MVGKLKGRKNIKLKKSMKGGNIDVVDSGNIGETDQPLTKTQTGSSYNKYSDSLYINGITSIGLVGILWMGISRVFIRHIRSEVVSYSLMEASVIFSLLLIFFKGVREISPRGLGIIGMFKKTVDLTKFMLKRCTPGLLIMIQLAVLISLMNNNADFIFNSSDTLPLEYNIFNWLSMSMIIGQCWVWRNKVFEIMTGQSVYKSPLIVPGFILAAILSGVAISQMWVILEMLRCDC